MAKFLNYGNGSFTDSLRSKIFVDKSMLIKHTNENISTNDKFMCVTRPRRFGKTMALSMLNAYYSKGCDSKDLFRNLKISTDTSFETHLNKHNVFSINMAALYGNYNNDTISILKKYIISDLNELCDGRLNDCDDVFLAFELIKDMNERFIFLIDEWDCIYRECKNKNLHDEYTKFLKFLFKDSYLSECIDLVYMTGILPIRRYKGDSTLNNFNEFNMIEPRPLGEFMGFTENEVISLCEEYNMPFEDVKRWYNGYYLKDVGAIYNPRSVVQAMTLHECSDYWTRTRNVDDIVEYINIGNGALKSHFALLLAGEKVGVNVKEYSIDSLEINSANKVLIILIHLGYLTYDSNDKTCYIPNLELKEELEYIVEKLKWEEIKNPMSESPKAIKALFEDDVETVAKMLRKAHITLCTKDTKTNEGVIGIIFDIVFYNIRSKYYVHKELNSSTGTADIVFIPKNVGDGKAVVIELKHNKTAKSAIDKIKEKEYLNCLSNYHGDVKLIGINYTPKTLKYTIMVNEIVRI